MTVRLELQIMYYANIYIQQVQIMELEGAFTNTINSIMPCTNTKSSNNVLYKYNKFNNVSHEYKKLK